jgi:hypothetical protein
VNRGLSSAATISCGLQFCSLCRLRLLLCHCWILSGHSSSHTTGLGAPRSTERMLSAPILCCPRKWSDGPHSCCYHVLLHSSSCCCHSDPYPALKTFFSLVGHPKVPTNVGPTSCRIVRVHASFCRPGSIPFQLTNHVFCVLALQKGPLPRRA